MLCCVHAEKKPNSKKLHRWRVRLIRSSAAKDLGYVYAETEADAVDVAIRDKEIAGPESRKRLVVSLDD